ncbi:hypothetical protein HALA3H3_p10022 [Halomonas sp. A3H3]|nr:hypothetical protein HALA3H3_p10022 [Halomonas sp. A3H3]
MPYLVLAEIVYEFCILNLRGRCPLAATEENIKHCATSLYGWRIRISFTIFILVSYFGANPAHQQLGKYFIFCSHVVCAVLARCDTGLLKAQPSTVAVNVHRKGFVAFIGLQVIINFAARISTCVTGVLLGSQPVALYPFKHADRATPEVAQFIGVVGETIYDGLSRLTAILGQLCGGLSHALSKLQDIAAYRAELLESELEGEGDNPLGDLFQHLLDLLAINVREAAKMGVNTVTTDLEPRRIEVHQRVTVLREAHCHAARGVSMSRASFKCCGTRAAAETTAST